MPKAAKKMLTLADIQAVQDVSEEDVFIAEWNGYVTVRSITKRRMNVIKANARSEDGDVDQAEVEKWVLIEGLANPQITEDDYEVFLEKNAKPVEEILGKIMSSSKTDKKALKEAEKQFRS